MIKEKVTLQETVDFLNGLLEIDPLAINALFSARVACNEKLANHETVQVGRVSENYYQVGMIGVLNGLFGKDEDGWGYVGGIHEDGKLIGFEALTLEKVKSFIEK